MNMCVIIIIITIYCIILPDDLNTAAVGTSCQHEAWFDETEKNNSSSCSIHRKPDVSLTVVLSNELSDVMFSAYGIRFS